MDGVRYAREPLEVRQPPNYQPATLLIAVAFTVIAFALGFLF